MRQSECYYKRRVVYFRKPIWTSVPNMFGGEFHLYEERPLRYPIGRDPSIISIQGPLQEQCS